LRITDASIVTPGAFEVLGGIYGCSNYEDNFDARRVGRAEYVLRLVRNWLCELTEEFPLAERL